MRLLPGRSFLVLVLAGLLLLPALRGAPAVAAESVRLVLDRPVDALAAPLVAATSQGMFRAADLDVKIEAAQGTKAALDKIVSGDADLAVADLNALVRLRDSEKSPAAKAVFVLFNRAPYAIVGRKSRGIGSLSELAGKTLGVADGDLAIHFWPALARINGVPADKVKQEKIGPAVREPMLVAGQVDAIAGSALLSAINLKDHGIPALDMAVLRFASFGVDAYGLAIIASPKLLAEKPEVIRSFVRAIVEATRAAIADPARAIEDVLGQMPNGARDLETKRWAAAVSDNILTDEVRRDGLGGVDPARFDASMRLMGESFRFSHKPLLSDVFDGRFLPAESERTMN